MTYKPLSFLLLSLMYICLACGDGGKESKTKSNEFLPQASLVAHELLVVMDSAQWKGVLGEAVRDVYSEPIPALPQEEAQFTLRHVQPQHLRGFIKRYPNILFVLTLDHKGRSTQLLKSMFSEKSLEQIQQDPQRYMLTRNNEFARGQEVMYLFGNTEDQLISRIYSNKPQLLKFFLDAERKRYIREFKSVKSTQPLTDRLSKQYGYRLDFPAGYEVAKQDSNFVWIRLLDSQVDKNVWVTWKPYTNQEAFTHENIISYRNSVARNYIWGSDSTTFMRLEHQFTPVLQEVNFNGQYAIEMRGLWRLENMVMGGPFISYTFVDEPTNRLYYLEGFTYAPGQDKRSAISELEAILWSFRSGSGQKQKK